MIPVNVCLKFAATPQRPVAAWRVRGTTAEEWLSAAAMCPGDAESLRILPLAEDEAATAPTAALLVYATGWRVPESSKSVANAEGPRHSPSVRACHPLVHGYGFAAERVLVPVEAVIEPPLTEEEWRRVSSDGDALFVWHPSQGLVRFDLAEQLVIADLLTAPSEQPADWTAARTAPAFVDRLWSVVSAEPLPTLAEVEAEWQEELNSRRPLDGLPQIPNESPQSWTEWLAAATAKFRAAWRRRFGRKPGAQSSPGKPWISSEFGGVLWTTALVLLLLLLMQWVDPLAVLLGLGLLWLLFQGLSGFGGAGREVDQAPPRSTASPSAGKPPSRLRTWFRNLWQRLTKPKPAQTQGSWLQQADQALRRREIDRLLHLLEQQPEEGLRHAIPFGGDPGRGSGVAGNELVRRDLRFGLSTGGGGPTDFWEIDPLQQLKLQQRYRELAEREQQAGRHRRAAYIYSQLLGDWLAAATALKAGQYYAEAAVIYQDRLHNLPQAAVCFEQAGQPDEALRIYRELKLWTAAGDLCERLGRSEEAKACYQSAVKHWLFTGEIRSAADVLENKLHDVDGALNELERTWPAHHNAESYFDLWFSVAARHHRHVQASQRIEKLANANTPASTLKLLPRLQQVRSTYPDAMVQHLAKESTLRLVSQQLPEANPAETRLLAAFLPGLSPQDRLLPRDCQRYVDRRKSEEQAPPRKLSAKPQLRMERRFGVPIHEELDSLLPCSFGWILVTADEGQHDQIIQFLAWDGLSSHSELHPESAWTSLAAVDEVRREVWLQHGETELTLEWPGTARTWHVTRPDFLPLHWLAVKPMPSGLTHVLWIDNIGAAWLTTFTSDGSTARSQRFAEEWLIDPATVNLLLRGRSSIWPVGDDNILAILPVSDEELAGECFDSNGVRVWSGIMAAHRLVASPTPGSTQMLVVREDGVFLTDDIRTSNSEVLGSTGWSNPVAAFLPGGLAALVDDATLSILNTSNGKSVMTAKHSAATALAVAPAGIGRFSVLREDGNVEMWVW